MTNISPFVASVFAWALRHGGCMTERQRNACRGIFSRVHLAWSMGTLACQLARDHPLLDIEPEGSA